MPRTQNRRPLSDQEVARKNIGGRVLYVGMSGKKAFRIVFSGKENVRIVKDDEF